GTYGSGPTTPWETTWETAHGTYRPSSGDGHGTIMKSTVAVSSRTTNGTSKPRDAGGFDALLTGKVMDGVHSGYGTDFIPWVGSSINLGNAACRTINYALTGVWHGGYYKSAMLSVRCKKD
ncbi:MAG: hypothetical protein LBG15_09015, partial [Dysgonamonadaceae bacterium]|nr:hypothetical protein [Dysgonamonadaceae bacterium]